MVRAVRPVPSPHDPGPGRSVRRNVAVVKRPEELVLNRRAPHGSDLLNRRASAAGVQHDRRSPVRDHARQREEGRRSSHVALAERVGPGPDHLRGLALGRSSPASPFRRAVGASAATGRREHQRDRDCRERFHAFDDPTDQRFSGAAPARVAGPDMALRTLTPRTIALLVFIVGLAPSGAAALAAARRAEVPRVPARQPVEPARRRATGGEALGRPSSTGWARATRCTRTSTCPT